MTTYSIKKMILNFGALLVLQLPLHAQIVAQRNIPDGAPGAERRLAGPSRVCPPGEQCDDNQVSRGRVVEDEEPGARAPNDPGTGSSANASGAESTGTTESPGATSGGSSAANDTGRAMSESPAQGSSASITESSLSSDQVSGGEDSSSKSADSEERESSGTTTETAAVVKPDGESAGIDQEPSSGEDPLAGGVSSLDADEDLIKEKATTSRSSAASKCTSPASWNGTACVVPKTAPTPVAPPGGIKCEFPNTWNGYACVAPKTAPTPPPATPRAPTTGPVPPPVTVYPACPFPIPGRVMYVDQVRSCPSPYLYGNQLCSSAPGTAPVKYCCTKAGCN